MGFGSRRPTRIPLLNARHRAICFAWIRGHRKWTLEYWKRVAWSDESRFWLFHTDRKLRIGSQVHESVDPVCQDGTLQGHGGSFIVWGVFCWEFLGLWYLYQPPSVWFGMYNCWTIISIHLCHPHGNGVFQQDNCLSYRSWLATAWFNEHSFDFSFMNWLFRIPDLNPEHLWDALETGVKARHIAPATLTELWTLYDVWQAMPV